MNTEKLGQIQLPAPEDFDPHPRLLLNGRGIHAGETFHALFPDGWREITIQALRCRCIYRSKPQDCRRFSVPLRRAAPPEQSRLPALRRGLYAAQAEARRTQSPAHGRISSFRARGNLFLCISGVNALHGLTDTIRALGVREVVEAIGLDQMTNPNVRKAVLAMRKEVQKIPAFASQSTHGTPCKGVDDSLLSRAATM